MGVFGSKVLGSILNLCGSKRRESYTWITRPYVDVRELGFRHKMLKNLTVMSSHNSVLGLAQVGFAASYSNLVYVLNQNFRMIELDVFKSQKNNDVVVSHGRVMYNLQGTNALSHYHCLEIIREYAFRNTNLPLFIMYDIQISTSERLVLETMEKEIVSVLGDLVLVVSQEELPLLDLMEMQNRIIIVSTIRRAQLKSVSGVLYGSTDFTNVGGDKPQVLNRTLGRVYPVNTVTSTNYDSRPFLNSGFHFVTMNALFPSPHLITYYSVFKGLGIRPNFLDKK